MTLLADYAIAALLVLGGVFGLIGSFGLLKLKDPMQRLHAPTKASTLGVGATLIASALGIASAGQGFAWQEILISAFLFLIPAFGDAPRDMLLGLAAGGCVILSAWLTREGLKAEAAFAVRSWPAALPCRARRWGRS